MWNEISLSIYGIVTYVFILDMQPALRWLFKKSQNMLLLII
jgi:hypothetical protein